ncbi:hypothetical protein [Microbulbifer sp. YPW16]|uniref:hypothetical protein n=1 Tax=Microbulbifer sp. YPW16 TaxID=2904242 RepID=UPI001E411218|nr:hypothetical protein [Microbulbifer sp. YPW16]UHQ55336.1 hypothetical protein LVE68_17795 [Microbulbifer sp. YPW16]
MYKRVGFLVLLFCLPGISAAGEWYGEAAYTSFHYGSAPTRGVREFEEGQGDDFFSLTGGYKFNRNLALEAGYTDFHEYVSYYPYAGITCATPPYSCGGYETQDINGFHIEGVLGKQYGSLYPYLELGVFFPGSVSPVLGAGVLWNITPSIGVNLYYEQFVMALEREDDPKGDVQSYNLGFRYTFN